MIKARYFKYAGTGKRILCKLPDEGRSVHRHNIYPLINAVSPSARFQL